MIEKNYFKNCPGCGKEQGYKHKNCRDYAEAKGRLCNTCSNAKKNKGKKRSAKHKDNIALAVHKRWGTDPSMPKSRHLRQTCWSKEVKKRDKHTCAYCEATNVPVEAHHILSLAKHPELASLLNNGITLCVPCHKEEHRLNGII